MYTNQSQYEENCNKVEILEKVIDIVFADEYPEDKEAELIELLKPYALKKVK